MQMKRGLLLAPLLLGVACATTHSGSRYGELRARAGTAIEEAEFVEALHLAERMERLAPQNPYGAVFEARALAGLGKNEDSLVALSRAIALEFGEPEQIQQDEAFRKVRGTPAFSAVLDAAQAKRRAYISEFVLVHRDLPVDSARSFSSYEKLQRDFARVARSQRDMSWQVSDWEAVRRQWRLLDEEIAALRRYRSEHPKAEDRDAATFRIVEAFFEYKTYDPLGYWAEDAPLATRAAADYLREFPNGERASEAAYLEALGIWVGRPFPADATKSRILNPAEVKATQDRFRKVIDEHPESPGAGKALYHGALLQFYLDARMVTAEVRRWSDPFLARWSRDEAVYAWAMRVSPRFLPMLEDWSRFEGTDLSGRRWSAETLRGRVVLIDFWATWCRPCVAELPSLKALRDGFAPEGLVVLGVNLDTLPAAVLSDWLRKHQVDWPQIPAEHGMQSVLAGQFRINFLPTYVVIGRAGDVVVASRSFTELETAIRKALTLSEPASGAP
jgi:thiol-disulfide isomerase/thioredoxin